MPRATAGGKTASLLGTEPSLELGQCPRIFLHGLPYYRFGLPESSKYPTLREYTASMYFEDLQRALLKNLNLRVCNGGVYRAAGFGETRRRFTAPHS